MKIDVKEIKGKEKKVIAYRGKSSGRVYLPREEDGRCIFFDPFEDKIGITYFIALDEQSLEKVYEGDNFEINITF